MLERVKMNKLKNKLMVGPKQFMLTIVLKKNGKYDGGISMNLGNPQNFRT